MTRPGVRIQGGSSLREALKSCGSESNLLKVLDFGPLEVIVDAMFLVASGVTVQLISRRGAGLDNAGREDFLEGCQSCNRSAAFGRRLLQCQPPTGRAAHADRQSIIDASLLAAHSLGVLALVPNHKP